MNKGLFTAILLSIPCLCLAQDSPPVIFVSGFQFCPSPGGAGTFGNMPSLLGKQSYFFDSCVYGDTNIESLASRLQQFVSSLPSAQVDVVAHSLGGLIVRAYLAGMQAGGGFSPPLTTKVRKVIFIATPHFGTNKASALAIQAPEMLIGSPFLSKLASWNQGTDDLRGVDAIAITGSGGSNLFDDGFVPLSTSSLSFAAADPRTRIVPYCHTEPSIVVACPVGARRIASVDDTSHLTYQIAASFFADTATWQTIGHSPSQDLFLSANGGSYVSLRSATDQQISLSAASATGQINAASSYSFASEFNQVFYREWMPIQPYQFTMKGLDGVVTEASATIAAGGVRVFSFKPGPLISRVFPAASPVSALSVAPGMFISIYGSNLAASTQTAQSLPFPTQMAGTTVFINGQAIGLQYVSAQQINAVLPSGIMDLVSMRLQNSAGQHSVNLMVEFAVPALFSSDGSGQGAVAALNAVTTAAITASNPAHAGQFVALFATGLGETVRTDGLDNARLTPAVTIAGMAAHVLYAGRAPGFVGLDQINIQVPAGVSPGLAPVTLMSNHRVSNTVLLPVE